MPGTSMATAKKLMDEVYDGMGVVSIPIGNTGGQTFGWFRKELKSPADFNGIKMRVAGFGCDRVEFRRT
jgi:TRAP-type mannitol/chloroaromatic compound transport system substrate-binding protein